MALEHATVKSTFYNGTTTTIELLTDDGGNLPDLSGSPLPIQYALLKPIGSVMPSRQIQGLTTRLLGDLTVLGVPGGAPSFNLIPAGSIFEYGSDVGPPSGFLWCDGTEYSSSLPSLTNLFAAIGTTYGSSGAGLFQVPDLRGRAILGPDNMGGVAASRVTSASLGGANASILGGVGGAEIHLLSVQELPVHDHGQTPVIAQNSDEAGATNQTSVKRTDFSSMASDGGSEAHNNMSPWMACNYLIKT